jgi:hypothetical protein
MPNGGVQSRRSASRMIRSVAGVDILPRHRASCHCGRVVLELSLPDGIVEPRRCNCSMCRRKGIIYASIPLDGLHIISGADKLRLYQFNTNTAKHYFCSICGIYTHHQRRSNPQEFSFNVACLDGINPLVLQNVPIHDGIHHVSDKGIWASGDST